MPTQSTISQKLAIDGGPKAVTNKLPGWPQFDEKAIKAVEEVLRSGKVNYWTGPQGHGVREAVRRVAGQQVRHQRGHRHGGPARVRCRPWASGRATR